MIRRVRRAGLDRGLLASFLLLGTLAVGCDTDPYCLSCPEGGIGRDGSAFADGGRRDGDVPDDGEVCVSTDGAVESCNGRDDDCDGTVDEGFDLATDPLNCGLCGNNCALENTDVACEAGGCIEIGCFDGFVDLDAEVPGCEYRCPVFPTATEECNGFDDDCDGVADEVEDLPAPPSDLCRTLAGTPCAGVVPVCATRGGRAAWFCDYPPEVEFDPSIPNGIALEEARCDGEDGDCDGVADDSFPTLGDACDNGAFGACRDDGAIRCDPADDAATICDLTELPDPISGAPSEEVCNRIDDNCDGIVDNSDPTDPMRVRDDMVHIARTGLDFWIYRYEASRPDASGADAGTATNRACSRDTVLPWATIGYEAAAAACAAAGHRLCTNAEWTAACEGAAGDTYPYGSAYQPATCNGADRDAVPGGVVDHAIAASGALAMCTSADGVDDLSGNVKEWTSDMRGTTGPPAALPIYVIRGGSYESPELGLTCQTDLSRARADTAQPTLGFRCCTNSGP